MGRDWLSGWNPRREARLWNTGGAHHRRGVREELGGQAAMGIGPGGGVSR